MDQPGIAKSCNLKNEKKNTRKDGERERERMSEKE